MRSEEAAPAEAPVANVRRACESMLRAMVGVAARAFAAECAQQTRRAAAVEAVSNTEIQY